MKAILAGTLETGHGTTRKNVTIFLDKGKIVEVTKGATTAHVKIDIGGAVVTASITNQSVEDLGLETGRQAYAVIKASDVMVAVD